MWYFLRVGDLGADKVSRIGESRDPTPYSPLQFAHALSLSFRADVLESDFSNPNNGGGGAPGATAACVGHREQWFSGGRTRSAAA